MYVTLNNLLMYNLLEIYHKAGNRKRILRLFNWYFHVPYTLLVSDQDINITENACGCQRFKKWKKNKDVSICVICTDVCSLTQGPASTIKKHLLWWLPCLFPCFSQILSLVNGMHRWTPVTGYTRPRLM